MEEIVRKNILEVSAYIAGKPIEETKRQLGLKDVIKLASNENPLGVSPKAASAIRKAVFGLNRYPDSESFYLKKEALQILKYCPAELMSRQWLG